VEGLQELKDWLLTHFDAIYGKLKDLKEEQAFTNKAIKRIEGDVGDLKKDVSDLKHDVSDLKTKTDRIEKTLDAHVKQPAHT
jgi:predicted  nucleic acid-binding Zn-ribbon protein